MDDLEKPATPAQIAQMRELVIEAMQAGAIGVSTGLFYEPAVAAPTEEVIEICRPLKEFNGLYCTHMRDEADGVMDSLEETFRIGREVDVPVVISHHKVIGAKNYGRSDETLAFIRESMAKQPICLDCYPYTAGSTVLSMSRAITSARVIVTWSKTLPEYAGQDLDKIAEKMGVTQEEAVERLLPAGAIYFRMDEGDVQKIMQFGPTMIGSDGLPHDASPHPRLWSTFPRVLGHYRRGLGLFSLETAVHKMTGLTAVNFGLTDRGVLKEGAYADLTLFNEETVDEVATYENPIAMARGINTVIVNGAVVWDQGKATGVRPGRVLSRPAAAH
jgi:N-acyl-D-amino-acid deacylase